MGCGRGQVVGWTESFLVAMIRDLLGSDEEFILRQDQGKSKCVGTLGCFHDLCNTRSFSLGYVE